MTTRTRTRTPFRSWADEPMTGLSLLRDDHGRAGALTLFTYCPSAGRATRSWHWAPAPLGWRLGDPDPADAARAAAALRATHEARRPLIVHHATTTLPALRDALTTAGATWPGPGTVIDPGVLDRHATGDTTPGVRSLPRIAASLGMAHGRSLRTAAWDSVDVAIKLALTHHDIWACTAVQLHEAQRGWSVDPGWPMG